MISSKHADESKTSETEAVQVLTDTNLKGDWSNFFLLMLMYTMQGVCLGLVSVVPILLKCRPGGGTYNEQALYSFSGYPFSLKLLWAPLVDAFFIHKCGRRKSWLVPTQLLIGAMLIYTASVIHIFLPETGKPNFIALIAVFTALDFLSATQDIAVDGWALTMLKKNNVGYASICNTTGQAFGKFLGNSATILLTSKEFSNRYLRDAPSTEGIVSFNSLLFGWGIAFMVLTTLIALFKKEKDSTLDDYLELNIVKNYSLLWNIFKIRNIQILSAALLTVKIGFATIGSVSNFKLMDAGVSKEDITILQSVVPMVNTIVPLFAGKYTSGPKALSVYLKTIPYRLFLNLLFLVFIYFTPAMIKKDEVINIPVYFYVILLLLTALHEILMYIIYVASISFFNRISDPRFGGTYMTLLNTLSNLGTKWTATSAFGLINLLTIKKCSPDNENINEKNEEDCDVIVDGYYLEAILCTLIGIIWIRIFRNKLKRFQNLSPSHWLVYRKIPVVAVDKMTTLSL